MGGDSHSSLPFTRRQIEQLGLAPEAADALAEIQAHIADAYRHDFVELIQTVRQQASALNRIQATLALLVDSLAPEIREAVPAAIRAARAGEEPDIASVLVVSDPIGSGYTLSQTQLAKVLGLSATDVSVLVRAFKLPDDGECAVVVRKGKGKGATLVNYHPRAVGRFRELVDDPPSDLKGEGKTALRRVRKKWKA